jgi:hypothetical protein
VLGIRSTLAFWVSLSCSLACNQAGRQPLAVGFYLSEIYINQDMLRSSVRIKLFLEAECFRGVDIPLFG